MSKNEPISHRSNLLASIVEYSDDAIISFLLSGTVLSWNKGAQKIFGYSVESTMGKTLRQLLGPKMGDVVDALKRGERTEPFEITFNRADGQLHYFSTSVFPIPDDEGNIVSGAAIFRDITHAKQAEKELLITSEHLAQSNKELEEFAWVAAHDLKEPVRTMGTYTKILMDEYGDKLDEQGLEFLDFVHRSSLKAIHRIDDVLSFSALRREELKRSSVDLNKVVGEVLEDLSLAITQSKAQITVAELPDVLGNEEYLSLLFQNILSNAVKYRGKKTPTIEVGASRQDDFWRFFVRDNGIGFKQEYAERIFQMFQRLHDEDEYPGTGLGLSMCKKVVELHGGRIWAESEPDKGSTFFFTLPAVPD